MAPRLQVAVPPREPAGEPESVLSKVVRLSKASNLGNPNQALDFAADILIAVDKAGTPG
jgi:hypothetical protein